MTAVISASGKSILSTVVAPYASLAEVRPTDHGMVQFKIGGGPVFQGWIDNNEGGRWLLIAQYLHAGGTNPALATFGAGVNLPTQSSAALGTDESAIPSRWGEATPAALLQFPDLTANLELRFFGRTSGHTRIVHFKTTTIINKWRDNAGLMLGVQGSYTLLPGGQTASLPRALNSSFEQQNINRFPFYFGGNYHWGIRGLGNRWEVDDFTGGPANHTIHQVWMRTIQAPNPLIVNQWAWSGYGGWIGSGAVSGGPGSVVQNALYFGGGTCANGGVWQQTIQLHPGTQRSLAFAVSTVGSGATTLIRADIVDQITNVVIATQTVSNGVAPALPFTARGATILKFTDVSVGNLCGQDCYVSGVMVITPHG